MEAQLISEDLMEERRSEFPVSENEDMMEEYSFHQQPATYDELAVYQQAVYNNNQLMDRQRPKSKVLDPRENELKDHDPQAFGDDDNAQIILEYDSKFNSIQFIEAFPKGTKSQINGTESITLHNDKQEPYLLFNVNDIQIESIQIEASFCRKFKIYSCKENVTDLSQWSLLAIVRNAGFGNCIQGKVYLQYKHEPFIKICFGDHFEADEDHITVEKIMWKGIEAMIEDEITDNIKIYQISSINDSIYNKNASKLLVINAETIEITDPCYVTFDCGQYQIDRLRIISNHDHMIPNDIKIKIRLSEIANMYSFKKSESFEGKTTEITSFAINIDVSDLNMYKNGFKRYVQMEFSGNSSWVNVIRVFGHKCMNIGIETEQFDAILDADVMQNREEEEKKDAHDTSELYQPEAVSRSKATDWHRNKFEFSRGVFDYDDRHKLHCVVPGFIIIDLGNNEVEYIRINVKEAMVKTVVISTMNKYNKSMDIDGSDNNEWELLLKHTEFDSELFNEYNLDKSHKKYLKIEFKEALKEQTEFHFPLAEMQCFGDSSFLSKAVKMTMDEYKHQNPINIGVTQEFLKEYMEKYGAKLGSMVRVSANGMRADFTYPEKGFGVEWTKKCLQHWLVWMRQYYISEELDAYTQETVFQQQELLKIVEKKKIFCHEFATRLAQAESNDNQKAEEIKNTEAKIEELKGNLSVSAIEERQQLQDKWMKMKQEENHTECMSVFQEVKEKEAEIYRMNVEQKYKNKSNEDIYTCFEEAAKEHPMIITNKYNVREYQKMVEWAQDHKSEEMKACWKILDDLFQKSLSQQRMFLHKYFVFMLSEHNGDAQVSDLIRDKVCGTLNKFRNNGNISTHDKHFIKFLLCWNLDHHYAEVLLTAKRIMNLLSAPLIIEYKRLQKQQAPILTLTLNEKDRLPLNIVSNHGLLEWDYCKWYKYRKAFFYPQDVSKLANEWKNIGLPLKDDKFKDLRHNYTDHNNCDTVFAIADQLAMEYLNLIAVVLDPSFQNTMRFLFEENRKSLALLYPTNNSDLGVLSGPIKTKARQNVKIKLDYCNHATPQVMNILDIVRCAVVCEEEDELCHLYDRIMKRFSGKILRVKNAFGDVNKGTYGYRAVLINIAYGDEQLLPKGYEMICEIQLLLLKYYQVRKHMHLGYGIVRSEDNVLNKSQQPSKVLAEDSCKFGKLDI